MASNEATDSAPAEKLNAMMQVRLACAIRYFTKAPNGGPDWSIRLNLTFRFPR